MGETTRVGSIVASIIALVASVATIVFLILGLCGVFGLDSPSPNKYRVTFTANEVVLKDETLVKGEKIVIDFTIPSKPNDEKATNYRFIGWDTNNDKIVNPIPSRIYSNIDAVAVYVGTPRIMEVIS